MLCIYYRVLRQTSLSDQVIEFFATAVRFTRENATGGGWQALAHHAPATYDRFAGLQLGGTRHVQQQRHDKGDDDGKIDADQQRGKKR
jgi:hypothetical protein